MNEKDVQNFIDSLQENAPVVETSMNPPADASSSKDQDEEDKEEKELKIRQITVDYLIKK